MEISPMTALNVMSAQGQTQQIMQMGMVKAAVASEQAMVNMMNQSMEMVKAQQASPPAGMGHHVDKSA